MQKIIYKIRQQPEEVRRHILHIVILCLAIILFFLWIYSLGTTLMSTETEAKINQNLKPFSALKANLIDGYNSISGSQ